MPKEERALGYMRELSRLIPETGARLIDIFSRGDGDETTEEQRHRGRNT
jgi:hypothetical protein